MDTDLRQSFVFFVSFCGPWNRYGAARNRPEPEKLVHPWRVSLHDCVFVSDTVFMSNSEPTNPRPDKEIFFKALDLATSEERYALLDEACGNDPVQRRRVEELLVLHFKQNLFMQEPAAEGSPAILSTAPLTEGPGTQIGRYKLLEKLGEGGFGAVYVAEQKEPVKRRVALKIIKLGMDTRQVVARFEAERQALALMDHPNIAKIFDAGVTEPPHVASGHPLPSSDEGRGQGEGGSSLNPRPSPLTTHYGRPYFVMELVRGVPITRYCDENNLTTVERLELFILVCHAIQHAHQKGIIHRDIKPSNIMVTLHDGVPVPKVIDFGIAKAIEGELTEKTVYTQFQQFIGTPAYMSPEQAQMSGLDIDTRSDIYSLGVLLYELLTGKTPFDAKELMASGLDAMRRTIREKEPVRPSTRLATLQGEELTATAKRRSAGMPKLIHLLKGDLDWIIMKCLEKDRTRRYETANGFSADLKRHLNNEPVVARPASTAYRLQKAFQRNKLIFSAGMAVAAALLIGISLSVWEAARARKAKGEAVVASQAAEAGRLREVGLRQQAEAEKERADQNLYDSDMSAAQHAWDDGDLGLALSLLEVHLPNTGETDRREFEWFYFWNLCRGDQWMTLTNHTRPVSCVAFSPDGQRLATGSVGNPVQIWDTVTGTIVKTLPEQHVVSLAFAPDGKTLGVGGRDKVVLWNLENEQIVFKHEEVSGQFRIAFPPKGTLLMIGKGAFPLFSPENNGGTAELWDYAARELKQPFPDSGGCIALSLRGDRLATGSTNQTIKIWDVPGGQCVTSLKTDEVIAMALSPDGQTLVTSYWDSEVKFWDVTRGVQIGSLTNNQHRVWSLVFSPDGRLLATGGTDQLVRLWDVATRQQAEQLQGHGSEVMSVAFSPDGQTVASGGKDKRAMLWSVHPTRTLTTVTNVISRAIFSSNGRLVAAGIGRNKVAIWDVATLQVQAVFDGAHDAVAFSTDGNGLITRGTNYFLRTFDVATQTVRETTPGRPMRETFFYDVLSPDAQIMAAGWADGTLAFFDAKTGAVIATEAHAYGQFIFKMAFSPNGKLLATAGASAVLEELAAKIWDTATHKLLAKPSGHTELVLDVAFTPDGEILLTCGADDSIKFWDTTTWKEIPPSLGQKEYVSALALSPNGRRLATACSDRTMKLWNVATRREIASLKLGLYGFYITFSPDGQTLAVQDGGGLLRVWRAPTLPDK
jgi:eukaryotic-like serine/threonine-protein kinase